MNLAPLNPPGPPAGAHPKPARGAIRHLARLAAAIVAVPLIGCDPVPTDHQVIGLIPFDDPAYDYWPLPEIPETATAGVSLEMTIWTMYSDCEDMRRGDTEVTALGRSAVVVPYDILTTYVGRFGLTINDPGCFGNLDAFEHKTTVVFEEPGTAKIILLYSTDGGHLPEYFNADGRRVYTVEVAPAG